MNGFLHVFGDLRLMCITLGLRVSFCQKLSLWIQNIQANEQFALQTCR